MHCTFTQKKNHIGEKPITIVNQHLLDSIQKKRESEIKGIYDVMERNQRDPHTLQETSKFMGGGGFKMTGLSHINHNEYYQENDINIPQYKNP